MIGEVRIKNYKSIQKLKLELGRVTVLIGENGCGKSNILEAIALASAAANRKLDNEFLVSRGIRVTEPQLMRSGFEKDNLAKEITIDLKLSDLQRLTFNLQNDNAPYSSWQQINNFTQDFAAPLIESINQNLDFLKQFAERHKKYQSDTTNQSYIEEAEQDLLKLNNILTVEAKKADEINSWHKFLTNLYKFLIYSPENQALKTFEKEGQIQPLGINGEGLFKLLKILNLEQNKDKINQIKEKLQLIDWFKDFEVPENLSPLQSYLQLKDKYLDSALSYFDQRSSNEGFLFLLFYFTLFISDLTPKFFAVDNIDASLNPRLCRRLIQELVELAKKHDKQVIFTTHNPAVLDGLDLDDDEQRLLVISRNQLGYTKARRILGPKPLEGQEPVELSEAFLRGYIGGLPKNF
ncbi:MAG: AAA family ATPase [Microcoleus sp.]